mmetsp:Transcript_25220/g.53180  ORF Transcript_25220/g.53180 Transcript_25220/m.53180 type:complete len:205 (-) Transcript_25220:428-1042(-)
MAALSVSFKALIRSSIGNATSAIPVPAIIVPPAPTSSVPSAGAATLSSKMSAYSSFSTSFALNFALALSLSSSSLIPPADEELFSCPCCKFFRMNSSMANLCFLAKIPPSSSPPISFDPASFPPAKVPLRSSSKSLFLADPDFFCILVGAIVVFDEFRFFDKLMKSIVGVAPVTLKERSGIHAPTSYPARPQQLFSAFHCPDFV